MYPIKQPSIENYFLRNGHLLKYKPGQVIINPQEDPRGVYYVINGHLKIYTISYRGNEKIIGYLKPRDIFPLLWVTGNFNPTSCYETIGATELICVNKDNLFHYIHTNLAALQEICFYQAQMLALLGERVNTLFQESVQQRVIYQLICITKVLGIRKETNYSLEIPVSFDQIAALINTTRESVSKVMQELIKKKIIAHAYNSLTITDYPALCEQLLSNS
jgi:CRP/FNR family transcriptional regulator